MADVGFISLILALAASFYSATAFVVGAGKGYSRLLASARKGIFVVFGLVSLAAYALYYALLSHDFELEYVFSHTSRDMPLLYNISSFWAGNAGALLLLAWLLSLTVLVVVSRKRREEVKSTAYTSAIIIGTLAFFLLLLIFIDNPFEKHGGHTPSDGIGLNPILENPGMVIHPPLLLAGYIFFTVPFALSIAALITKKQDSDWLSGTRTWALLAWLLLGAGNLVGAWWAYVELGWGGYWAWDPIENAGLMPWLVGTAFLHSITVQRKTGMLKVWTMALIILSFNLCIFGMFLNRSDFLSSVHNYTGTGMEPMFLTFLAITLLGPLCLMLIRRDYLKGESSKGPFISKENSFVLTNILFIAATFAILLGTMLPWLSETIGGTVTTVKASFFNKSVVPIFLLIILLVGVCISIGWRRTSFQKLFRNSILPLSMALILCLIIYLVWIREWYVITLFPLCSFVVFTHLLDLYTKVRTRSGTGKENPLKAFLDLLRTNRPYYGGMIVHLGIALIAIGIIGSSFHQSEAEAGLLPGDSIAIENYTLTYEEMSVGETSNKIVFTARLSVYNGESLVGIVEPEKSIHFRTGQTATEVAIRSMPYRWFPAEDLYVILAGQTEDGAAIFQIFVNPLVSLIWVGGGVLALGGIFAFWPGGNKESSGSESRRRKEEAGSERDRENADDPSSDLLFTPGSNAISPEE
ncbi:heme lyase CcmF/NrfE family subunit [Chloroflexota bacterium]